ncbi:hypothetical protein XbrCFBP1976_18275 [Xanthomonas bromi]|uniref:Uncharacterized protein n=1 Tax=Xanthomonas bromi TaxID=56449 RepID=A0ABX5BLK3_9XANT|nr:hypothetical protein XbrCFBP1976_18275 [Xanthomonas bromi]
MEGATKDMEGAHMQAWAVVMAMTITREALPATTERRRKASVRKRIRRPDMLLEALKMPPSRSRDSLI